MPDDIHKNFVNAFIEYLKSQIKNGIFSPDIIESLEVAIQCLEAAYEIDSSTLADNSTSNETGHVGENATASGGVSDSGGGDGRAINPLLLSNLDLFELFQAAYIEKNPEKQKEAEDVKNEGNRLMKEGKFYEALLQYNKAIRLDPTNPVFYCNRAAAHTRLNEFGKAITDCKISLSYNPGYGKAYGRMGVAYSNLQKIDEAREAYKRAIDLEPENLDYQNNLRLLDKKADQLSTPIIQQFVLNALNDPLLAQLVSTATNSGDDMLSRFRDAATQFETDNPGALNDFKQQILEYLQQTILMSQANTAEYNNLLSNLNAAGTSVSGAPGSSNSNNSDNSNNLNNDIFKQSSGSTSNLSNNTTADDNSKNVPNDGGGDGQPKME